MSTKPFLYKFASKLNEASIDEPQLHFDEKEQVNLFEDGSLSWFGVSKKIYTNTGTPGHWVPAHYTKTNKYVLAKRVSAKTDRRSGK